MLMTIQNSQYITIKNNMFFTGIKALVQINNSQYIKFLNNALIYVKKRVLSDGGMANWAVLGNFIYMEEEVRTEMTRDIVEISGNVGQGSLDTGFFIMASKCSNAYQSSFYNNHCSGAILACFGIRQDTTGGCTYVSGLSAFHSKVGVMFSVYAEELQIEKVIVAENHLGVVLRGAPKSIQDNKFKFSNSIVSAFVRSDCPQCYSESLNPQCSDGYGLKMGTVASSAFPPISTKPSDNFDSICTVQRVDLRVYINNVEFNNFRLTYDTAPRCGKNAVFKTNVKVLDMTGQHYLSNSPCSNCEFDALLYKMKDSDWNKLGWFGGCGSFECTGQKNILIEDQTGDFFGQIGQAITNNTYFGPNVTHCIRKDTWNGYWCPERKITTLMFMSTAPDYNKRLYSPVKLTDGLFFNEINSFSEWNWDGPEPLNLRESKFVALISTNTVINMTNAGMNPTSSEYWLSKRTEAGSPEDFAIIKLQFQVPQIIRVSVNNKVILPGLTTNSKHHDLMTMTTICGANNYFFENRTIHFVVTGQLGCKVKISLKNTLQVSTRLEITSNEFFGDKFIQYARAQLGGDPYNYFIIGTKKYQRRFLDESVSNQIQVDWAIVHGAEIGSAEAVSSENYLADFATQLESFIPPIEVGKVLEQSSQITAISELKYTSTEEISATPYDPTQDSNGNGNSDINDNFDNSNNENIRTNTDSSDDEIILVSDEVVNEQEASQNTNTTTSNATIQKAIKQNESSKTIVIVVSVICSIVGVSIIIAGLFYYKKVKLAKLMAARAQKVDNEFFKVDVTEHQLQQQHPEQQEQQ